MVGLLLADLFGQIVAKGSFLKGIGALHHARFERRAFFGHNLTSLSQYVAICCVLTVHRVQVRCHIQVTPANTVVLKNLNGRVAVLMTCPQIVHYLNLSLKSVFETKRLFLPATTAYN